MLTRELAGLCRHVIAVEIDEWLSRDLQEEFAESPHVEVVGGDFLRFELPSTPFKVVGNIPYSRTAAIVKRLVDAPTPPEDACLVVQREAAERFAGGPYGPETLTSLLLKPWWQVEILRRLRRTDFDPPPRVGSVLLWLARRPKPLVDQAHGALYRRFIGEAFGRVGNTARQCLRPVFTGRQLRQLARDLRFDLSARPSGLSFDQWLGLFRYLALVESEPSPV